MDPLEILPPELWRMIFEKVEDGQDWLNLYRASPTFEGVVGDEQTRALLTKVMPQLSKYLGENPKALLPLRLVSRHWKKAVDTTLETADGEFGDEDVEFTEIQGKYNFVDSEIISRFLNKFGTHPGNPFIGRLVRFIFDPDNTEEVIVEYGRSVQRLMARFGPHVRKMWIRSWEGVRTNNTSLDLDYFLDQLRHCVQFAPNLEGLNVQFFAREGVAFRLEKPILGTGPSSLHIIPKLKSFSFAGRGEPNSLVGLQNILVRLCCSPPDTLITTEMVGVPMELTTFPNLETAYVLFTTRGETDVSNLMNSSWPLTQLTLSPNEVIPLDVVVEVVEHFKETLTSLWICSYWRAAGVFEPYLELQLDLPRLQYLSIPMHFLSFRLLANLPNLRNLRISEHQVLSDDESVNELYICVENLMSRFRVWEILPKLRKLEVMGRRQAGQSSEPIRKVYYRVPN